MRLCRLLVLGSCALLGAGCVMTSRTALPPEVATQERPAVSPSGEYMLVVVSGYDGEAHFQSFQIVSRFVVTTQDRSAVLGETVYAAPERFATRHTTYFLWDQDDRVWVYSGDVGTFFWEYNAATGDWEKHASADSDVSAPEFLQSIGR